jgi:hypothetical protein
MKSKRSKRRRYRRWRPTEDKLLASASDVEIGRRLGRTKASVKQRRKTLQIAAHRPRVNRIPPRRWTDAEDRVLGTASDREVARLFGRTTSSVLGRRRGLGIASYLRTRYRKRIEALAAATRQR